MINEDQFEQLANQGFQDTGWSYALDLDIETGKRLAQEFRLCPPVSLWESTIPDAPSQTEESMK